MPAYCDYPFPVEPEFDYNREDLAPVRIIDLGGRSAFESAHNKLRIQQELSEAVASLGFLAVTNHGISNVNRVWKIARHFLQDIPQEVRLKYVPDKGSGNLFGYTPMGHRAVNSKGTPGHNHYWNIPKFTPELMSENPFPAAMTDSEDWKTLEQFSRECHALIINLLRIFANVLGVSNEDGSEQFFERFHNYSARSGDHIRMIEYPGRDASLDEDEFSRRLGAHTDHGTLTLLFSQPVGGLQVLCADAVWRYVAPVENGIICNVADFLELATGGYLPSSLHRVVRPPPPQEHLSRFSLVYFLRPNDDTLVTSIRVPSAAVTQHLQRQSGLEPAAKALARQIAEHLGKDMDQITAKEWIGYKVKMGYVQNVSKAKMGDVQEDARRREHEARTREMVYY
ncbi:hypothetical protein HDU93_000045 [Gonapodya sp. JEL0774]|nr:hypothetical protein HDU93_000045 [Gonapodya sp. JEL0774]